MALQPCPECGHQMSTGASACPSCGAPAEKKSARVSPGCGGCLVVVLVLLVIGVVASPGSGPEESEASQASRARTFAALACEASVKAQLRAPSTAKFPGGTSHVTLRGDSASVASYVDAQNAFGGTIRSPYVCEAWRVGDSWRASAVIVQ
jgi:hypothetical protein